MKTKLLTPSLTIAALAMISAPFAKGSVIWSDDFNQYSMGTNSSIALPIGTNSPDLRWWSANNDANRTNTVHKDSSDLFGEGTNNQYLNTLKTSGTNADNNVVSRTFTGTNAAILTLDFYIEANAIDTETSGKGIYLRFMSGVTEGSYTDYDGQHTVSGIYFATTSSNSTIQLKDTGNSSAMSSTKFSFTADQKNSLKMVLNNSSSSINYAGTNVASGKMDMYLNDTYMATWNLNSGASAGVGNDFTGLWLQVPATVAGEGNFDNFSLETIPEPHTAALALAGITLFAILRRRKQESVQ